MKKFILLLMLVSLVACNQSEDDMSDSQQWSTDTIPNPGEEEALNKNSGTNKIENKSEKLSPFQKEDIAGEWDVTMIATAKSCENKEIAQVVKERWFINFEDERLNITVMTKGSDTKQYWGFFEGKRLKAIADKKLTEQEFELINENESKRNVINLEINSKNLINGIRVVIGEDKCRTDYSVTMKR